MTFIEQVLDATQDAESPEAYLYWAALMAIAATVRNKVWFDKIYYNLYPNMYVLLVGNSGLRKGLPGSLAANLVDHSQVTRVLTGRMTIQGLVKKLSRAETVKSGAMYTEANCFLASGEYAASIVDDPAFIHIMTDLYDTHAYDKKDWVYTLSGEEERRLTRPCLNFMGASNVTNLAETLPKFSHGGGFIARTFIVQADKKRKINSLMYKGKKIDYAPLYEYLEKLSLLEGEFSMTEDAREYFDHWYNLREKIMERDKQEDPTGTLNRLHDQVLKIAMNLCLSESPIMQIKVPHIEEAIQKANECVPAMRQITVGAGKAELAVATKIVMRRLIDAPDHKLSREKLLQYGTGDFDVFDLDRIMETLSEADWVKKSNERINNKSKSFYTLQDWAVNFYERGAN